MRAIQLPSNETLKAEIVRSGGLGYLISMSKSAQGLAKMYAIATLTNLEHDTAATRIQICFVASWAAERFGGSGPSRRQWRAAGPHYLKESSCPE